MSGRVGSIGSSVLRLGPAAALLTLACLSCSGGSNEPSFDNPFDPANGRGLPVPDSVSVSVGNNQVLLEWSLPEGEAAEEFVVFRRRLDSETAADGESRLAGRVTTQAFRDTAVRNGRLYAYRIAAGANGLFGERTEEIEARPALFGLALADDTPRTRSRSLSVLMTAPVFAVAVSLSEVPGDDGDAWRPYAPSLTWVLSAGDGEKTVYARFRLFDGSESLPVSDSIFLDTRAVIESVEFDGPSIRGPGETVHFRLAAGETGGRASVDVPGLFAGLLLFDDGSVGDAVPGDGIYERDIETPPGKTVIGGAVIGHFIDDLGNTASDREASRTLTVQSPPDPVTLFSASADEPPDAPGVVLRWSESADTDFSSYRVFRAEGNSVDMSDRLVATIASRTTLEYADEDVVEGRTYAYLVTVRAGSGLESGSDPVQVLVPNLRSPAAVTLEEPDAVTSDRIALVWTRSNDRDFAAYRVHRNNSGAVSEADPMVAEVTDIDRTFFDDNGLQGGTEYFYRIYVLDEGGLSARSNEQKVVTLSEGSVENPAPSTGSTTTIHKQ